MSKKSKGQTCSCDKYTASTLAAASIMQYFAKQGWKMVSFFPNSACANTKKCKYKSTKPHSSD